MRQVEGMETDAVDERPPSASPASPTRKEKRNEAAMGKATPRAPRRADLGRRRLRSSCCAPSPAGGRGEGAGGSITWMDDPSSDAGDRRTPAIGEAVWGRGTVGREGSHCGPVFFLGFGGCVSQDYFGPCVEWAKQRTM